MHKHCLITFLAHSCHVLIRSRLDRKNEILLNEKRKICKKKKRPLRIPSQCRPIYCQILGAIILSLCFICFRWMTPFLWNGSKNEIKKEDLHKVLQEDESKVLGDKLER